MPISRITPDGKVEIYNYKTNEKAIVAPEELGQYSPELENDYQVVQSLKSGNTTLESLSAEQRKPFIGILEASGITAESKKQKEAKEVKTELQGKAQSLLDILNQGKTKKLSGQAYKDALNFAASQYAAAKGFGEGGKALTAPELTTLGGQIPVIKQRGQSFWDKFTGNIPPQTGEVVDNQDTLRRKAMIALAVAQGKEVDPNLLNQTNQSNGFDFSSFMKGDIQTVKDLAQAGRTLPQQGGLLNLILKNPGQFAETTAQGIGEDIGQATQDPGGTLYRNPIGSALNVLGVGAVLKNILKKGVTKGLSQGVVQGVDDALPPSSGGALQKILNIPSNVGSDIRGRAATSIAVPNPESVTKSEGLMRKLLQATKSTTTRGIAKETENIIPKAGQIIDSEIGTLNNKIGPMPRDEITEQVIQKISNSSEARTNPKSIQTIRQILREELKSGQLEGGSSRGELFATDMSKVDATRKSLNADLKGWHNSNRPVGTPTNDLNSLKWQASNALKDILAEADEGGIISRALDLQHTAFETVGPISKKALTEGANTGILRLLLSKAYDLTESARISGARKLQGPGTDVAQMVRTGQLPSVPSQLPPQLQQVLQGSMKTESPLPIYPNTPLGDVLHLKRDFRFKQGNFQARKSK